MENGAISDDQITATTTWNYRFRPENGRLNFITGGGREGSWASLVNDLNQWLQVDFQRSTIVTGISTQGRQDYPQFVRRYTISSSDDQNDFNGYKNREILKVSWIN